MAGQLDSLFKNVAKSVVSQLGASQDYSITYTKKASPSYNTSNIFWGVARPVSPR